MANPLDEWRSKASFKPSELKEVLFGEEVLQFQQEIWDRLLKYPQFAHESSAQDLHSRRALTLQRLRILTTENLLPDDIMLGCPQKFLAFNEAIQMLDGSLLPAYALNTEVGVYNHILSHCSPA